MKYTTTQMMKKVRHCRQRQLDHFLGAFWAAFGMQDTLPSLNLSHLS